MNFKVFLETIETPPHLPRRFYEEHIAAFKHVVDVINKIDRKLIEKFLDEFYGRSGLRNDIDYFLDLSFYLVRPIQYIVDTLDYVTNTNDADKLMKNISKTIDKKVLDVLKEIDYDLMSEKTNKLKKEIQDSSEDWHIDFGDYEAVTLAAKRVGNLVSTLKNMRDWYAAYCAKTKAHVDQMERKIAAYYDGKNPDRNSKPETGEVEVLYHATTAVSAILSQGFKTREELGGRVGIGGGPSDVISFTSDLKIAEAITWALRRVVEIAQGKLNIQTLRALGVKLGGSGVEKTVTDSFGKYEEGKRDWLFQMFRHTLAVQSKIYDPWFAFVDVKDFEKVNPKDIGIIAAEVDMTKVQEYLSSMEEYRVPISAIRKSWKVPYGGVMKPFLSY